MRAVLVTTEHRGVFFGYVDTDGQVGSTVTLKNARNCVYWSSATKGFLGLAVTGPDSNSRIGPRVEELTLLGVTSVSAVSDGAIERWEAQPWG